MELKSESPAAVNSPKVKRTGISRLWESIGGKDDKPSHEVAANWLLLLGFFLEFIVLHQLIVHRFMQDFGGGGNDTVLFWIVFVMALPMLLALLSHQFLIFRNFAIPEKAETHRIRTVMQETATHIRAEQEGGRHVVSIDRLSSIVSHSPSSLSVPEHPVDKNGLNRIRNCEIVIYCLFGVLTGEAGYMLTIMKEESVTAHGFFSQLSGFIVEVAKHCFGTHGGHPWGATLESMFLAFAAVICAAVLRWDYLIQQVEVTKSKYKTVIDNFLASDRLSFGFWIFLFVVVNPGARWLASCLTGTNSGSLSGLTLCFWVGLVLMATSYIKTVFVRLSKGVKVLGELSDENKAALIAI